MKRPRRPSRSNLTPDLPGVHPASDADQALFLMAAYYAFTQEREQYRELFGRFEQGVGTEEIREPALEAARHLAVTTRTGLVGSIRVHENLVKGLPADLNPVGVLLAAQQIIYALTALADEQRIPEMLLSREELDGLDASYGLGTWFETMHGRYPLDTGEEAR